MWSTLKYSTLIYKDDPKENYLIVCKNQTCSEKLKSLNEVDPAILSTYEKLGIPLEEQKRLAGVAVDYVFDSTSVATTFNAKEIVVVGRSPSFNGLKNSLEQAASIMGFSPHFPENGEYASALGALLVAEKNPSD